MIAFSMEIAKEPPFFIAEVVNLKDFVLDSKSIHVKIVNAMFLLLQNSLQ